MGHINLLTGNASVLDLLLATDPADDANTLSLTRDGGGLVTQMQWVDNASTKAIKQVAFTRTDGAVVTEVTKVFGPDGTTIAAQKTDTISRTDGIVTSIATTRDV